ncbi:MAG: Uma2 family endonuclease [Myxacorys californica WJT36-NPBG1]|nr:Uma2 family endonuclease [Myxacorys californica WJT36-NPBG1]
MYAIVSPENINLPPGTVVRLLGNWQDYLALTQQRGDDKSIPRIKYRPGEILLMAPLPAHGFDANILADVAKELLDHSGKEYQAYTLITMQLPERSGFEPDYCFYIDNWAAVTGKRRIDWSVEPPPDLVIEIDVTSYTDVNDYLPYRVPEVWLFKTDELSIYGLQDNAYVIQSNSRYFPEINLSEIVRETLQIAIDSSTSAAIRALRKNCKKTLKCIKANLLKLQRSQRKSQGLSQTYLHS